MRLFIGRLGVICLAVGFFPRLVVSEPVGPAEKIDPEALERVQNDGVFFSADSTADPGNESLKAYLLGKDPYADLLAPEEYASFAKSRREPYAGIGLELERNAKGFVYCYPDPAGPAARAGIVAGDRLVAIDGLAVQDHGLPALVAMASGTPGSHIDIDIAKKDGNLRRFTIRRTLAAGPSVSKRRYGARSAIEIRSFTPNTRQELEFALLKWNIGEPLILDLRGNRGGDLSSAIDCATLFLGSGVLIATVRGRHGSTPYVSSFGRPPYTQRLFLWQDEGTASAAEVFIAALTENCRATSIGRRSFGKGTKQEFIGLKSGAMLILTTGYLLTPSGMEIDGRGLAPGYALSGKAAQAYPYLRAVKELMRPHKEAHSCR